MLSLSHAARQAIVRHGEQSYPDECVGLLLGSVDGEHKRVAAAFPVENRWFGQVTLSASDDPTSQRDRFYLDPRDYLRADRAARAQGLDVIGCYHSHPDAAARPSERDRTGAQGVGGGPFFSFIIVSVRSGRAAELASRLLASDGSHFEAEALAPDESPEE
jgi:proteasome lid subunit RPN8/RPN11